MFLSASQKKKVTGLIPPVSGKVKWHQLVYFPELVQLTAAVPVVKHCGNSVKYYFE